MRGQPRNKSLRDAVISEVISLHARVSVKPGAGQNLSSYSQSDEVLRRYRTAQDLEFRQVLTPYGENKS